MHDSILSPSQNHNYMYQQIELNTSSHNSDPFTIECQDWGACYYKLFFHNQPEHADYLGHDANIGPVAISVKREKLDAALCDDEKKPEHMYRFIMRTLDLLTLRGAILEEHIVTAKTTLKGGLSHKEIIGFLAPKLDLNCLRLAEAKCGDELVDLDEKYLIKDVKVGVLLCRAGQTTEEEMYNNVESTRAFDEFLELLGNKVRLRGFEHFRGGLDNASDTTGTHSVYTLFRDKQIMFHVSTMLPHSPNDKQQVKFEQFILHSLFYQTAKKLSF